MSSITRDVPVDNESQRTGTNNTNEATKKRKGTSKQAIVALGIQKGKQEVSIEHCVRVLKVFTTRKDGPEFWGRAEYKGIRECVDAIKLRPNDFPHVHGDTIPDGSSFKPADNDDERDPTPALTKNYVSSIAHDTELENDDSPILQVVSTKMGFENTSHYGNSRTLHFTHLRLLDGSGAVMAGRLSMDLAHEGNRLDEGDIIQLRMFTPCKYPPSGENKGQRSPMVLIHSFARVGYDALPSKKLPPPMHCHTLTDEQLEEYRVKVSQLPEGRVTACEEGEEIEKVAGGKRYERLVEVDCTAEHRYCSVYGLSTVLCVCVTDPVDKVNLEVVRQYCYFATKELSSMDNSNKRNMLYWWYMTNTYNVCGKGERRDPPACLKAAIRKAYPEEDGWYVKYEPGSKKTKKRSGR